MSIEHHEIIENLTLVSDNKDTKDKSVVMKIFWEVNAKGDYFDQNKITKAASKYLS